MANLKNLIGKALNKANGLSSDDEGKKKKKKESFNTRHEKHMSMISKTRQDMEKMRNELGDKRPSYNTKAPASAKTPKPAPIQAAKEKRDKEQAKWNDPYRKGDVQGSSNDPKYGGGGPGGKWVESPARKEANTREVKELTQPGGLKKKLTEFERSRGRSRQEKFKYD
jgi:hypothetical protein